MEKYILEVSTATPKISEGLKKRAGSRNDLVVREVNGPSRLRLASNLQVLATGTEAILMKLKEINSSLLYGFDPREEDPTPGPYVVSPWNNTRPRPGQLIAKGI